MTMPQTKPIHDAPIYWKTVASTLYEPGDLVYHNGSGAILPASSQVDQLTEALNQLEFAANFVGVCNGMKLASDSGTGELPVIVNQDIEFTVVSGTFAVGDFLGADEAASGTALEDQQLKAVTDIAKAVAIVTKAAASATKVWARPFSRFGLQRPSTATPFGGIVAQTLDMADAAVVLTKTVGSPAGTYLSGNLLLADANSAGTENLDLPPEADMTNELLIIKNTGGETINVRTDAGGAVSTLATSKTVILHCDGTNWNVIQFTNT
jgi:hypothetical protein